MKLWTGDEWRALSDLEALHRLETGCVVLEDDDPRTATNDAPVASPSVTGSKATTKPRK